MRIQHTSHTCETTDIRFLCAKIQQIFSKANNVYKYILMEKTRSFRSFFSFSVIPVVF